MLTKKDFIMKPPFDFKSNKRSSERLPVDEATRRYDDNITMQSTHDMARYRTDNSLSNSQQRSLIAYNHVTYLLYLVSYLTAGLLWIVPIAMNYGKRRDAEGSWLATHFDWQIKTFWYSIVWFVIGLIVVLFSLGGLGISTMMTQGSNIAMGSILTAGFGLLIIVFTVVWHIYRIARGWIALTDKRPVP